MITVQYSVHSVRLQYLIQWDRGQRTPLNLRETSQEFDQHQHQDELIKIILIFIYSHSSVRLCWAAATHPLSSQSVWARLALKDIPVKLQLELMGRF